MQVRGITVILVSFLLIYFRGFSSDNTQVAVASNSSEINNLSEYTVVPKSVYDGDTIRVVPKGKSFDKSNQLRIRFACIDAPEKKQIGGIEARDYLEKIIVASNNIVKLKITDTDRYGRKVAEVYVKENQKWILSQEDMAGKGLVWPYAQYSHSCTAWPDVEKAALAARSKKLGVHSGNQLPPWQWRKSNK
ncbi:MAG: thermonuclease family protein [Xenococcus sp. (in: cyanobacteria)]